MKDPEFKVGLIVAEHEGDTIEILKRLPNGEGYFQAALVVASDEYLTDEDHELARAMVQALNAGWGAA